VASLKMQLQDRTTHLVRVETATTSATIADVVSPTWDNTFHFITAESKVELWNAIREYCTNTAHAAGFTPIIRLFVDNEEVKRIIGERPPKGNTADHFEL
jgi:hypothetical protein